METVTKRQLNQHTASVLDLVTATDDIVVTERGKPRWRVSLVGDSEDALVRLARAGRYTPPVSGPAPWPDHPGGPAYTTAQADALLDELRGGH